ncbi:DUF4262 domain-containing protein [Luteipulveratus mongoliensis]|uniref:DUF4262 domain-containing protein n=1 Tax=Luteipulveratus mongoliensis TaxID=571913 RepID=A0A0K1JPQ0_9MICO|nr:DUF4262 domain-containing protein [Luteipulveratus mongoliensis]AKU18545.1 hypothetical protein VV02_01590 [Luteipulveratus mongoliensis]
MNDLQEQAWLDQEDANVRDCVRTYGCFLTYVLAGRKETSTSFCYTTGLFGIGHPELIVFGLSQATAGGLLNLCYARVRDGHDLMPGEIFSFAGAPERVRVEVFPRPGDVLYTANRFYERPDEFSVPAYQLTWDVEGAFPEDAGYPYGPHVQPAPGTFVLDEDDECGCGCGC